MKKLQSVEEVTKLIEAGRVLSLAGDERALSQLPKGQWIAGTTPYFMGDQKGEVRQDVVYVDDLTDVITGHRIEIYSDNTIPTITRDRFDNGFTILVIPAFSDIHVDYALHAADYDGIYDSPMAGWVSGINLDSDDKPQVYHGMYGKAYADQAVALHVEMPADVMPQLEIINIHHPDENSPVIEFDVDSFEVSNCTIDGKPANFAEYVTENNIDTKSPLTSDYSGAIINSCIKEVNVDDGKVHFYAPIFKGRKYKFALPLANYAEEFAYSLPQSKGDQAFSCNCVLNFLYGELEGKQAGYPGPITFGEIGYQLLNQTMTYINLVEIDS